MILQLRQMRLTDASTFMVNSWFHGIRRSQPFAKLHHLRRDSYFARKTIRARLRSYGVN
jgi:hypothetical protein